MYPKQITRLALIVAGVSIIGGGVMLVWRPAGGLGNWWPVLGLGLAGLLLGAAFLRGAYLSAQQRVAMVDKLNDCYTGVSEPGDPVR